MKWIDRLKELLAKDSINQEEYDEFIAIRNTLKSAKAPKWVGCLSETWKKNGLLMPILGLGFVPLLT